MAKNLYPWQTFAARRQTKVLSVEAYLSAPGDDAASPLELHSGFSRFLLTIIDKDKKPTATPKANIPCRDLSVIVRRSEEAIRMLVEKESSTDETNDLGTSAAYKQTLMFGVHKGKTPAEVLLKNPGDKEALLKDKKWLESNLSKFPANKAQIDAIDDAITLLEIGELNPVSVFAPKGIKIYKTEYKHFSEKDSEGNHLIYAISMYFDPAKKNPFICEISNCWAPIEIAPTGAHRPIMSQSRGEVKSSIALSEEEWCLMMDRMSSLKTYFELTNFRTLYARAVALDEENRKNS